MALFPHYGVLYQPFDWSLRTDSRIDRLSLYRYRPGKGQQGDGEKEARVEKHALPRGKEAVETDDGNRRKNTHIQAGQ